MNARAYIQRYTLVGHLMVLLLNILKSPSFEMKNEWMMNFSNLLVILCDFIFPVLPNLEIGGEVRWYMFFFIFSVLYVSDNVHHNQPYLFIFFFSILSSWFRSYWFVNWVLYNEALPVHCSWNHCLVTDLPSRIHYRVPTTVVNFVRIIQFYWLTLCCF